VFMLQDKLQSREVGKSGAFEFWRVSEESPKDRKSESPEGNTDESPEVRSD
jgi:hypothetical protein